MRRMRGEAIFIKSQNAVKDAGYLCFDATHKYRQIARYMNHAKSPNAVISKQYVVRGKWRIGFLAIRDTK